VFCTTLPCGSSAPAPQSDEVAARRAEYLREIRRRNIPGLLLSDGTIPEALTPGVPARDGLLVGMAAAPGTATGRARVVLDPADAHVKPGEILVVPTSDPGWTPLFMTAAGLVHRVRRSDP
jgi:pyruvate,water dikinase